jgi:hypothetical protein
MSVPGVVAGVAAIWLAWSIYSGWPKREEAAISNGISYSNRQNNHDQHKRKHPSQASSGWPKREEAEIPNGISYSNPQNNHDQHKQKHPSRASAEAGARRMQARHSNFGESGRFIAYYNRELDAWYAGRGKLGFEDGAALGMAKRNYLISKPY